MDTPEWEHIDATWPRFSTETRNVRLGLAIDGVNPHKLMKKPNSIWPVLTMNYNIPPWLAMKKGHVMLTLIILGPSTAKNLDVWLAPIIEELTALWEVGVPTTDVSRPLHRGQQFQMYGILMHSISDGQGKRTVYVCISHEEDVMTILVIYQLTGSHECFGVIHRYGHNFWTEGVRLLRMPNLRTRVERPLLSVVAEDCLS
jgi:hypothetical protein